MRERVTKGGFLFKKDLESLEKGEIHRGAIFALQGTGGVKYYHDARCRVWVVSWLDRSYAGHVEDGKGKGVEVRAEARFGRRRGEGEI